METISNKTYVKTRKVHFCHWCCRRIEKWEITSVFTWKDEGIFHLYTCSHCTDFINLDENKEWVRDVYVSESAVEWWVLEFENYKDYLKNNT